MYLCGIVSILGRLKFKIFVMLYAKYIEKRNIKGFKGIENPYCMEFIRETFFALQSYRGHTQFNIEETRKLYTLIDWCKLDKLDTIKFGYIGKTLLPEYKNSPYLGKTLRSLPKYVEISNKIK